MTTLRSQAKAITGKELVTVDFPDYYRIGTSHLEIPGGAGKKEQAIHEVLHWVIAEDWQREHSGNLGFGHSMDDYSEKDPRCTAWFQERQELMACHAQRIVYQLAGKPFPKKGSCTYKGRDKGLTEGEVDWVTTRCSEVGWNRLVDLARSRW